jgi:plant cysteine oxidase
MFADRMKPEDVGLSPDLKFFRSRDAAQGTPTITHTTIYNCPNFSVSLSVVRINSKYEYGQHLRFLAELRY